MSVSTIINRATYAGDGTTLAFSFSYYFSVATDLYVFLYDTTLGTFTPWTLGVDYTVTGTPNTQGIYSAGGGILATVAPAVGKTVVIVRDPSRVQNYSLLQNGLISSTALVQQLDYMTLLIQRLEDQVARAILLPDGMGATFSGVLPSTIAIPANGGTTLAVNSAATGMTLGSGTITAWQAVTIPYTSFQTAGLTKSVLAFNLPAVCILTGLAIKHTASFGGGALASISMGIGTVADTSKFILGYDAFTAPGDTVFDSIFPGFIGSFANATTINITATSTGANLSALTSGSVTVYFQYQLL